MKALLFCCAVLAALALGVGAPSPAQARNAHLDQAGPPTTSSAPQPAQAVQIAQTDAPAAADGN